MKKIWQFLKKILFDLPRDTSKILEIKIISIIYKDKEKIKSNSRKHPLKAKHSKWLSIIYLVLPAPLFFLLWFYS